MTNKLKIQFAVILFFFIIVILLVARTFQQTAQQIATNQSSPTPSIQTVGERIDLVSFSIELPEGWVYEPQTGMDSFVGAFKGEGVTLLFDYGYYSNTLARDGDPKYSVTYEVIDGRKAKIVRSNVVNSGLTGIFLKI